MAQRLNESLSRAYARTPPRLRSLALRRPVIAGIFRAMPTAFDRERAKGTTAVMHWEIELSRGHPGRWQVVIEDGRCRVARRLDREPTLTLRTDAATFLDLVTGAMPAPALYMAGRLRVEGDVWTAAQLTSLFRVPRGAV